MGEAIFFYSRPVIVKGLNRQALPQEKKVRQYLFKDDYQNLKELEKVPPLSLPADEPLLLYPACGSDILFPLLYLEKLFPGTKKARFLFVDLDDTLALLKTILDDVGVSFVEKGHSLDFYWKGIEIDLQFRPGNIFELISSLPCFDIYFERAFQIMKEQNPGYEQQVWEKLKPGGILISDSGFHEVALQRIPVPLKLSSYQEMVVGVKVVEVGVEGIRPGQIKPRSSST